MKPHRFILKWVIPLFAIVAAQAGFANDPNLSPSGVISIGDSLTAGLSVTLGGTVRCAAQGNRLLSVTTQNQCRGNGVANVGGWQPSLSQRLSTSIFNNGNSGELTPTISARLGPLLATQPSTHVLIMTGTNDAIRGERGDESDPGHGGHGNYLGLSRPHDALEVLRSEALYSQVSDENRLASDSPEGRRESAQPCTIFHEVEPHAGGPRRAVALGDDRSLRGGLSKIARCCRRPC